MSLGSAGPCVLAVPLKGSELCTLPAVHGEVFTASLSSVTALGVSYYLPSHLNATKSALNPNCIPICHIFLSSWKAKLAFMFIPPVSTVPAVYTHCVQGGRTVSGKRKGVGRQRRRRLQNRALPTSSTCKVRMGAPLISRIRSAGWMAFRTSGLMCILLTLQMGMTVSMWSHFSQNYQKYAPLHIGILK